jgi:hypothetical protein
MARLDLNEPCNWLKWIRACAQDEGNPIKLPGSLGMLTGQDKQALGAIAYCWHLYAISDDAGARGALDAVRALLPAMQPQCRLFARELVAQALDWDDRARLWDVVMTLPPGAG